MGDRWLFSLAARILLGGALATIIVWSSERGLQDVVLLATSSDSELITCILTLGGSKSRLSFNA